MTIEEDRAALQRIRSLESIPYSEYRHTLMERIGVSALDQIEAAARDSRESLLSMVGKGPFVHSGRTRNFDAELAAGLLRCLDGHKCEHASAGGRELRAFLGARVITCKECAPRFLDVIADQDARVRAGEDWLCDFCLEEAEAFVPSAIHYGPVILMGDMCDRCADAHREDDD